MGSNLKSKDLPEVIKNEILEVFGSLKQTVLWKFEEKMANLPKNVHILDWAPQQSILGKLVHSQNNNYIRYTILLRIFIISLGRF